MLKAFRPSKSYSKNCAPTIKSNRKSMRKSQRHGDVDEIKENKEIKNIKYKNSSKSISEYKKKK